MAKLIVGLGNVGREFEGTNHNMGFMAVDRLLEYLNVNGSSYKKQCSSQVYETNFKGEKLIIAKPTTYMNSSGIAIKSLVKKYGVKPNEDLIVISDDIDLPAGNIRLKADGSAGTHNGLKSVIHELGVTNFKRLRVGIDKPPEHMDLADYVLSRYKDKEGIARGLDKALDALVMFIGGAKLEDIQQKYN